MKKLQTRHIILVALLLVAAFFFFQEYLGRIELPTAARLNEKLTELDMLRSDLEVARQEKEEHERSLMELQELTSPYWIPSNSAKIEQEITNEFSKILRRANVQATQKVDAAREKNGSFLQEIFVTIELRGGSMQQVTRFFQEFSRYRNADKFSWENVKIGPDNARTPKGVNMTAKFKVVALNQDAMALLGFDGGI